MTGSPLVHCPDCDQPFVESQAMRSHRQQVHRWECAHPTCVRDFGSENAMKNHHAKTHGKSLAGVTVSKKGEVL